MNRVAILAVIIGLFVGFGAGVGATYYWLVASQHDAAESEHEGHDHDRERGAHSEVGEGEHEKDHGGEAIRLTEKAVKDMGIETAEATAGTLEQVLTLPGEVVLNTDTVAHIVPRVAGIVRKVHKTIGDEVKPGEVMAVLESRELAEAKANYLAAKQRLALAQANLTAKEKLKAKGIVPELEFLAAHREHAEGQIDLRTTEHKLHALGVTHEQLPKIDNESDEDFSVYELRAPFAGKVTSKHITLGEVLERGTEVYVLADMNSVWVNLTVYQKDLTAVRIGQPVTIVAGHGVGEAAGVIDYVSPVVQEATRSATARVTLKNPDGRWRPGLFVTGRIQVGKVEVPVLALKTALQIVEDKTCVFVQTDEGFSPRPVTVGRSNKSYVEITAGLRPGERYVSKGAFSLKAEIGKESFAGEGHAH